MLMQLIYFVCVVYCVAPSTLIQEQQPVVSKQTWNPQPYLEAGFPTWIMANLLPEGRSERKLFVLIGDQDFTLDNLQRLFLQLSTTYKRENILSITVFSDEEMVERAIDVSKMGYSIDFADTPEGQKAAQEWYKKYYPTETGYFRAYYTRSLKDEGFRYSPDKHKSDFVEVTLKSTPSSVYQPTLSEELMQVVIDGRLDVVKKMLLEGININTRDQYGWTPLILAAKYSRNDLIQFLVSNGADVNLQSDMGLTALHLAASQGNLEAVKTLLSAGAVAEVTSKRILIRLRRLEGYRVANGRNTPLLSASSAGHTEIVIILLQHGADPNVFDDIGKTPLMAAHRFKDTLKALLDSGADINAQDAMGKTALMYAVWGSRTEEAKFLLSRGADIKLKDEKGQTVIDIADQLGNKAMIELLRGKVSRQ